MIPLICAVAPQLSRLMRPRYKAWCEGCEFPEFQLSPLLPCDDEMEKGQMPEEKKKENDEGNILSFDNCANCANWQFGRWINVGFILF